MNNLFLILFLISILGLIIGLIQPKLFSKILKGKTNRKTVGLIFGSAIVLFFILFGVTSPNKGQTPTSAKTANNTKSTTTPVATTSTPTPTPTATATPTPKEQTIMDKLWTALDNSIKTRDKYDISYDDQKNLVVVTRKGTEYWDETDIVKDGYSTLIKYGQAAFKIDGVNEVEVVLFSNFTDQYGKSNEEKAVDFAMEKDEFSKYDWNGLKGQNIFNQMTESCSIHYINPAVFKNVKTDKLIYL